MAHPTNRQERFLLGFYHGIRRSARDVKLYKHVLTQHPERADGINIPKLSYQRRDTTTACSCSSCCNRRKWEGPTRQEVKFQDSIRDEIFYFEPKIASTLVHNLL